MFRSNFAFAPIAICLIVTATTAQTLPVKKPVNPPIKEVPVDLDLSDPKKQPDPLVFLEAPDLDVGGKDVFVTGLVRRELYRQALLLAARDEMGMTTRDAVLGEPAPDDLPPLTNRLRVNVELVLGKPHRISIECGPAAASRLIWKAEADTPSVDNQWPADAAIHAESLARGGFLTALKRAGLRGKANTIDAKVGVPADIEKLVQQMTFPAQFAAVRQLHQIHRTKGESAATLGALSRAYANLGMLTDTQWGGLTWVFKARGLLYAERLRQRDPKSPLGHWHSAYAAALAGSHASAIADLKKADEIRGGTPVPEWAALAGALCRFDTKRLNDAIGDGPYGDTAALFKYLTVENRSNPNLAIDAGVALVKRVPECYRVHDSLAETGGVGFKHGSTLAGFEQFSKSFSTRVGEMPDLPQTVTDAIKSDVTEPELVKSLFESGKSRDDRGEPSWAVLGRFSQESRFIQVYGRLLFLQQSLAVSTIEYLDEVKHLIADHPHSRFIDTFRLHPQRDRDQIKNIVRGMKVPELSRRHGLLMNALATMSLEEQPKILNIALQHGDLLYYDLYLTIRNFTPQQDSSKYAKWMSIHSPFAPMARASLVSFDWQTVSKFAEQWEKEAQHPEVFVALGRRAVAEKRPADAERLLSKAIKISPDLATYRLLADLHLAKGDRDKWIATLEQYLKEPDPGLNHARVRVDIAEYHMSQKKFKEAEPYVNAAAETYAGWAMLSAAKCAEGLEDFATSEQWVERVAKRYSDSVHVWYYWCLRTGRGNLKEAESLVEDHLKKIAQPSIERDLFMSAIYHMANGRAEKAPGLILAVGSESKNDGWVLLGAIEFDALDDKVKRDRALSLVSDKGPLGSLTALIKGKMVKGKKEVPAAEEIENAFKTVPTEWTSGANYLIGRFLQTRGEKKLAAEYLRKLIDQPMPASAVLPVLASMALRELEKNKKD